MPETRSTIIESPKASDQRKQVVYFEGLVDKRLSGLKPYQERGRVGREEKGDIDFYYQRSLGDDPKPFFAIQERGSNLLYEFGIEEDKLVRRVIQETPDIIDSKVLALKALNADELGALLSVMQSPKESSPEILSGLMSL